MANDQAGTRLGRELAQVGVHFTQRFANELDPSVHARQRVENVPVKHKQAVHLAAGLQRQAQCRVVVYPQIAAKPHQSGLKLFVHVHR